jgi:2-polyprenyl-3-methyl-5-hydroxy-6-metoxy-1,4-benzoquinol methylase
MCDLVFVHPDSYLSSAEEFKRYEQHNNDPDDPRYRSFLSKLQKPVAKHLAPGSSGLDFGSGPGPLLKQMFEEQGHNMAFYDTFYAPDIAVFEASYDFITTSETVEHLQKPRQELERLWSCLKPGGILGIMTGVHYTDIDFKNWYYIRDETHVIFFSPKTFKWLAQLWGSELEFVGDSVILFKKALVQNDNPAT